MNDWWRSVISGRDRSLTAALLRLVLRRASFIYWILYQLDSALYRSGLRRIRHLPVPVICVGNITVGGTGKTPAVVEVLSLLRAAGHHPGILTRGYRSKGRGIRLIRPGEAESARAEEFGEEAVWLARRNPETPVAVGANRYLAGRRLIEEEKVDCLVQDDGFQHWALYHDLNIVLLDATNPFGYGRLLPAGLLREPPMALRNRADLVILTRCEQVSPEQLADLRRQLTFFMTSSAPILEASHEVLEIRSLSQSRDARSLEALKGRAVVAISAIGHPEAFHQTLKSLGAELVAFHVLPDHTARVPGFEEVLRDARARHAWVMTTDKDATRWQEQWRDLDLVDVFRLSVRFVITKGGEDLNRRLRLLFPMIDDETGGGDE